MKVLWKINKYLSVAIVTFLLLDVLIVMFFSLCRPAIKTKADAIIVLGAAINTPALYNRSLEGLRLYDEHKTDVMVLSGGRISDKDISEAGYMKKVIDSKSGGLVPLLLEENSHSTYENLINSQVLIGKGRSVIIVSDEFHLGRAVVLA